MIECRTAYCSWCFQKSLHKLYERNSILRNIYECSCCGNKTLGCQAPNCNHMTRSGNLWDNQFCAQHSGMMPSFERQNIKINNITDYHEVFDFESPNYSKISRLVSCTIAGAVVMGPVAAFMAPSVGAAVGGAAGLSGAAATSYGLATFGGGAIAAGGLGMAGGTAIIMAGGAALGGGLGMSIAASYISEVEGFDIIEVRKGIQPAIIIIDGFDSQDTAYPEDWINQLNHHYKKNAVYYLKWESKRIRDIQHMVIKHVLSPIPGPLKPLHVTYDIIKNPWHTALAKASQTGIILAEIIARTDQQYILMGHSLGARVIYYALEALSNRIPSSSETTFRYVQEAHLLGGAVPSVSEEWNKVTSAVSGHIYNYHSDNDAILKNLYRIGNLFMGSTPIGITEILGNRNIKNVDVTSKVEGHTDFKPKLKRYIKSSPTINPAIQ